ncbi:T9SS type A sorting domain-containing protein [Catalinimonas sp. 4WD22]|uniref:T9SS type A sorting domain-containing protein n=1 Tax=Catalinimonas locisalis TaxID=3133978 RepID=UPI003101911A
MQKTLLIILLSALFCTSALVSSANIIADRAKTDVIYEPINDAVDVVVYPNPAEENIFVRLDLIDPSFTYSSEIDLEIRSLLGTPMPVEAERIDANRFRILTADFPAGYYLLIVQCKECNGDNEHPSKEVFKFLKK